MTHNNDLHILQKLFFDKIDHCIVFDPAALFENETDSSLLYINTENGLQDIIHGFPHKKLLVFDFSKKKPNFNFNQSNIIGSIHFNSFFNNKNTTTFQYINNPDKSIRWFFPSANSHPGFLALYNNSGLKASAYKSFIKIMYSLNCASLFTSGSFTVWDSKMNLSHFFNGKEIEEYAVFTGTAGKNRKTIMALFQKNSCSHFVKIPLTETAQELVQREQEQLENLEKLQLNKMITPKGIKNSRGLCLTNIKPFDPIKSIGLNDKHLNALKECYSKTHHLKHPSQLSSWKQIVRGIQFLNAKNTAQNNLSRTQIAAITTHINILFDQIKDVNFFSVALAHGDFTPWNMYEAKNKIHVYDWEMASSDMPVLFDALHYVFQNAILIQQKPFEEIKIQLDELSKNSIIKSITNQYELNWSDHYAFYLLFIVSYYLPQYIQQKNLHQQAHWLVDCWAAALADLVKKKEFALSTSDSI